MHIIEVEATLSPDHRVNRKRLAHNLNFSGCGLYAIYAKDAAGLRSRLPGPEMHGAEPSDPPIPIVDFGMKLQAIRQSMIP